MTSLLDVAALYVDVVLRAFPNEWPLLSLTGGVARSVGHMRFSSSIAASSWYCSPSRWSSTANSGSGSGVDTTARFFAFLLETATNGMVG